MENLPASLSILDEVKRALRQNQPIVALESTVITHGLPSPHNISLARDMEGVIRSEGVIPATIGILHGVVHVGLTHSELDELAAKGTMKISRRDIAAAITKKASGGTTVAGTMFAADLAGIQVFATGGIGGVHREARFDVSPDLQALASTRMIVVCAGAKSILDLPATLEYLETMSVPVLGYGTDEFPAFFSRQSGFKTSARVDSPQDVVTFARAHWELGMQSAVLVCQPIPVENEISRDDIDPVEEIASREAQEKKISGQALTPFLLQRVNELTRGVSMRANLALLLNNARLAALIAKKIALPPKARSI